MYDTKYELGLWKIQKYSNHSIHLKFLNKLKSTILSIKFLKIDTNIIYLVWCIDYMPGICFYLKSLHNILIDWVI